MTKLVLNKSLLYTLILILSINFLLEYYYTTFVTDIYAYLGFTNDFNIFKYIESKFWLFIFLIFIMILNNKSKFIYALYIFLGILIFIPSSIMFSYSNSLRLHFYSVIIFFIAIFFIAPLNFKIKVIALKEKYQYYLLIVFSILLLIPIIKDIGFNIYPKVLLLKDIYQVRTIFAAKMSTISSYTFWWLVKSAVPVIIIFSLIRKNKLFAVLAFFILMYLFLISGHKSVYLTPVIVLFFYFTGKNIQQKTQIALLLLFTFLIIINLIDIIFNTVIFRSLFIRRVFFVPSLLTQYYFDFFQNKPLFLSHSIFSKFIEYPYELNPAHLIAKEYFNKPEMAANNGVISDGYMNFGFPGVILYSLVFSFILAFFNSININEKYFGIFVYFMMVFSSSALLTIILTHGLWLIIIFALLIFPNRKSR